jgi:hypothetical protein
MAYRVLLALVFAVGLARSATAQAPQSPPPSPNTQHRPSENVRIALEMRWLAANDRLQERLGLDENKLNLPAMGSSAVLDENQTKFFLLAAEGDKRSNPGPTQRITLLSGQKRQLSPPGTIQGDDAILATVSDDRQTIEVQLTWPKRTDGTESLPVTIAVVPVGSHLLLHTEDCLSAPEVVTVKRPLPFLDRFRKNVAIGREKHKVFLLITPRVALDGEKEDRPAAK